MATRDDDIRHHQAALDPRNEVVASNVIGGPVNPRTILSVRQVGRENFERMERGEGGPGGGFGSDNPFGSGFGGGDGVHFDFGGGQQMTMEDIMEQMFGGGGGGGRGGVSGIAMECIFYNSER